MHSVIKKILFYSVSVIIFAFVSAGYVLGATCPTSDPCKDKGDPNEKVVCY